MSKERRGRAIASRASQSDRSSGGRCHPADACAARLAQDGDAADAGDVEQRAHQRRPGLGCLLYPRVDIIDGEIGHPVLGNAGKVWPFHLEDAGHHLVALLGHPIGAAVLHRHWVEGPADGVGIELLGARRVVGDELVPAKVPVRALLVRALVLLGLLLLCCLCHVTLLFWGLRKIEFELVEASGPATLVAVPRLFVEELLMDQREQ